VQWADLSKELGLLGPLAKQKKLLWQCLGGNLYCSCPYVVLDGWAWLCGRAYRNRNGLTSLPFHIRSYTVHSYIGIFRGRSGSPRGTTLLQVVCLGVAGADQVRGVAGG
jgi:hypothetical protein